MTTEIDKQVDEIMSNMALASREQLTHYIHELLTHYLTLQDQVKWGVAYHPALISKVEVTFDKPDVQREVFTKAHMHVHHYLNELADRRSFFSTSGAMRWPNSQEAPIHFSMNFT